MRLGSLFSLSKGTSISIASRKWILRRVERMSPIALCSDITKRRACAIRSGDSGVDCFWNWETERLLQECCSKVRAHVAGSPLHATTVEGIGTYSHFDGPCTPPPENENGRLRYQCTSKQEFCLLLLNTCKEESIKKFCSWTASFCMCARRFLVIYLALIVCILSGECLSRARRVSSLSSVLLQTLWFWFQTTTRAPIWCTVLSRTRTAKQKLHWTFKWLWSIFQCDLRARTSWIRNTSSWSGLPWKCERLKIINGRFQNSHAAKTGNCYSIIHCLVTSWRQFLQLFTRGVSPLYWLIAESRLACIRSCMANEVSEIILRQVRWCACCRADTSSVNFVFYFVMNF